MKSAAVNLCNRKRIQRYKTQLLINAFSITVEIGILYLTSVAFTNVANLHHVSRGLNIYNIAYFTVEHTRFRVQSKTIKLLQLAKVILDE